MHATLDSGEPQRRARGVSEWSVRRKVASVLAVPLLLAVALGGLRVGAALLDVRQASSTADQVTVLRPAIGVLSAAQDTAMVFQETDEEAPRQAALSRVRSAVSTLQSAARGADLSESQRTQIDALLVDAASLQDGGPLLTVPSAVDALGTLVDRVNLEIAGGLDVTPEVEGTITLVREANDGRLALTQQQLLVLPDPAVLPKADLFAQLGIESAALANLDQSLPENHVVSLLTDYNSSNKGLVGIGTAELKGSASARMYDKLSTGLLDDLEGNLAETASASKRTAAVTALLVLLALLAAVLLALAISRALVTPVRKVRDGALAVANQQLPETVARIRAGHQPGTLEPIDVTTTEEMGQLARAVDDLHFTAVRLAQDEAELRSRVAAMFVTLSRRSTSLVNQQLHLIELLERGEEDPERLESLFRLDHLASRMRRTAESLEVLADAPTQRSEQDALTVTDALHAAMAGVQDYQRVTVEPAPRLHINGAAAADLVHLLTELVDNALTFSPPTAPVVVTTTAPSGLVLIEIRDSGLGIDADTLAQLNQDLRSGGELNAEATRRMGLLVVSRLARRHGVTVLLNANEDGGVTAQVFLPRLLLTGPGVDAETTPQDEVAQDHDSLEAAGPQPALVSDSSPPSLAAVPPLEEVAEDGQSRPTLQPVRGPQEVRAGISPHPDPSVPLTPKPAAAQPLARAGDTPGASPAPDDTLAAMINAHIRHTPPSTSPASATPAPPLPRRAVTPRTPVADVPGPEEPAAPKLPESSQAMVEADTVQPALVVSELLQPTDATTEEPGQLEPVSGQLIGDTHGTHLDPVGSSLPPAGHDVLSDTANGAVRDHLTGAPAPTMDFDGGAGFVNPDDEDTPLFRMLRSSWFDGAPDESSWGPSEADAGWKAAERARESAPAALTNSGLPIRNPGNRLVPGGVSEATPLVRRDPEAIRARLASHAAGVARGRSAALCTPTENEE